MTLHLDSFTLGGRPVGAVVLGVEDPESWKRELDTRRGATTGEAR